MTILTSYYNPQNYKTRTENYKRFKEELGHDLLTIECAFGTDPFTLKDSVKLRANSVLWQKERLLRIGEKLLPKEQDYVIFLDCDVIFENKNWLEDTKKLLKEVNVVQPFKTIHRRNRDWSIEASYESFGYRYAKGIRSHKFEEHGHTGFAFACRRDCFDLYDRQIAGTGDHLWYHAAVGQIPYPCINKDLTGKRADHFYNWAVEYYKKTQGKLSFVEGEINHLYHGSIKNRNYSVRMQELEKLDYDPVTDVYTNGNGLLEIRRREVRDWVSKYFSNRKEDDE
jgi:hypothetical protein